MWFLFKGPESLLICIKHQFTDFPLQWEIIYGNTKMWSKVRGMLEQLGGQYSYQSSILIFVFKVTDLFLQVEVVTIWFAHFQLTF